MVNDQEKPVDLYALKLDVTQFREVNGTTLAFAPLEGAEDAFAVRDLSNVDAGTIRVPGSALRKLGIAL